MTTKLCKKCNVSKPIVEFHAKLTGRQPNCKSCVRKWNAAYHMLHREERKEYAKANYAKNRCFRIAQAIKWNKEHPKARSRIMVFQNAKRRARKTGNGGTFTAGEWRLMKTLAEGICVYCGDPAAILSQDHFIPLIKLGRHEWGNIIPCCCRCNSNKSDSDGYEWLRYKFGQPGINRMTHFKKRIATCLG